MIRVLLVAAYVLVGVPVGFVAAVRHARWSARNVSNDEGWPPLMVLIVVAAGWLAWLMGWLVYRAGRALNDVILRVAAVPLSASDLRRLESEVVDD